MSARVCGACHSEAEVDDLAPDDPGWLVEREPVIQDDGSLEVVDVARVNLWKCPVVSCGALNEIREELR